MKKYALFLAMIIALTFSAAAQSVVKWTHSVKMTSATEGVVTLTAKVDKGWHVYGLDIPKGGPKPTSFNFDKSTGIATVGAVKFTPKPTKKHDKAFDMDLTWWANKVTFTQKFKVTDSRTAKIAVTVRYMACNDTNCMPPKRETFEIAVPKYSKKKK